MKLFFHLIFIALPVIIVFAIYDSFEIKGWRIKFVSGGKECRKAKGITSK